MSLDSYRLEFLVLAHCGIFIVNHVRGLPGDNTTTSDAALEVALRSVYGHTVIHERGIYDDMELLRYVVLYAFSDRLRTVDSEEQPPGFAFLSNTTTAYTHITYTLSDKRLLDCFGVGSDSTSEPKELLMAMRKFLISDNGKHIGARILENADFPRMFDESAAVEFMDKANAKRIEHGCNAIGPGTLDANGATSDSDLSAKGRKEKGVDIVKNNTYGFHMDLKFTELAQTNISNPPAFVPRMTRSRTKVLESRGGSSAKENTAPMGNK
ncbi:hypothetical protein H4R27_001726 [Coemansia aciculifera]|nr:hypothetical protein H4R27_001726 [Coemansia aciculifera]